MNMPGFTAEASLYKTSVHFYIAAPGAISSAGVMPQQAQMRTPVVEKALDAESGT